MACSPSGCGANLEERAMEYTNQTSQTDTGMNNVRDLQSRTQDAMQEAGRRWNDAVQVVSSRAREAARYTEQRVQQNPWTALGVGFGAGVIMGVLLMSATARR